MRLFDALRQSKSTESPSSLSIKRRLKWLPKWLLNTVVVFLFTCLCVILTRENFKFTQTQLTPCCNSCASRRFIRCTTTSFPFFLPNCNTCVLESNECMHFYISVNKWCLMIMQRVTDLLQETGIFVVFQHLTVNRWKRERVPETWWSGRWLLSVV